MPAQVQKQKMSNLDYHYLAQELKEIQGARLNKIYELSPGVFRFKFTKEGNDFHLVAELGVRLHFTKYLEDAPQTPPAFTMFLRKHLENARLVEARQLNFDRILALRLQKEHEFFLVFEMFAKGNLLLCDAEWTILQPYRKEEKSGRILAAKQKFSPPENAKTIPTDVSLAEIEGLEGKSLDALSKAITLAPTYLKNILARLGIEENEELSGLPQEKKRGLAQEIKSIAETPVPTVYYAEGQTPTSFCCIELALPPLRATPKKFETLSKALDEYYQNYHLTASLQTSTPEGQQPSEKPEGQKQKSASPTEKELEKLQRSLELQLQALSREEKEAGEIKAKGDAIYANFEKAGELLEQAAKKKEKKAVLEID